MIYSTEQTARIFNAISDVMGANNGYATMGLDATTHHALCVAGFVVKKATDLFGMPCYRVFSPAGYAAFCAEWDANFVANYEHAYISVAE